MNEFSGKRTTLIDAYEAEQQSVDNYDVQRPAKMFAECETTSVNMQHKNQNIYKIIILIVYYKDNYGIFTIFNIVLSNVSEMRKNTQKFISSDF